MKIARTKLLSFLLSLSMVLVMIPIISNVRTQASQGLRVSYSPSPLTAGLVSELVDPGNPFTIYVNDENGEPVDLTLGGKIDHKIVWNSLFQDHHPEKLGQYYWTRTSLHNDNQSRINNKSLFGFEPIVIDFSQAAQGKYVFRNFVANDSGMFYISVYTPDRRKAGTVRVDVMSPRVTYEIINTEDPDQRVFTVPGDPDFILTAADNRLYRIDVSAFNAQGIPLRGIDKDVNVCSGLREYARFTPFTTRPANFDFTRKPTIQQGRYQVNSSMVNFLADHGGRYYLYLGIDYNMNGKIDVLNKEAHPIGAFNVFDLNEQNRPVRTNYITYYVTSNIMWENGTFATEPQFDLSPPETGWGLGSIYNHAHDEGYLFADLNADGKLNYRDSLVFDTQGKCSFYIFSDDVTTIGGLVACHPFGDHDVAGGPPLTRESPTTVERRYRPDHIFHLDFDAISWMKIGSGKPRTKVYNARTGIELGKLFLNPENYDLTYSIENHLRIVLQPADPRDMQLSKEGIVNLQGAQHQNTIYGRLSAENDDTFGTVVTSATMHFTPTGAGERIAWMDFIFENKQQWPPHQYKLEKILYFDSISGGGIKVTPSTIYAKEDNEVFILVTELGTEKPVNNALVKANGCGVEFIGRTNSEGRITSMMHPVQTGEIFIEVTAERMLPGEATIRVVEREKQHFLELDSSKTPTNIRDIVISGRTLAEATVTIEGRIIPVASSGAFSFDYQLKEGINHILVVSNYKDIEIKRNLEIVLDTIGPNIMVNPFGTIIDQKELSVEGRVEPDSRVHINQIPALVVHDLFNLNVPVELGFNTLYIEAWDALGNKTTKTIEIYNYHQILIELVIGKSQATINKKLVDLDSPPLIIQGRTLVPVRFIAEAFGATVEWVRETETIIIELEDTMIVLQIGNQTAFVNGKAQILDAPPLIIQGRTLIPVRFIAEAFGATVEWVRETETVVIKLLK